MVKLPPIGDRIAREIYQSYEENAEDWRRPHLGASIIGRECTREIWMTWRWAVKRTFEGRMLRLFKRGHLEEAWVIDDLRAIGVAIEDEDPDTGEQWQFSWLGGHFGGSCDGLIRGGVPGAPKAMHVFECKTASAKQFATLRKKGVRAAKPEHYTQMNTYIHGFRERGLKIERALYVSVCKDNDDIYTERLHFDQGSADAALHRAKLVVKLQEPPAKISQDPSRIPCAYCAMRGPCQLERVEDLERNCRTCIESTPTETGEWRCELLGRSLSVDEQREGCGKHLFIPALLPWKVLDAHEGARAVLYEDRNGVRIVDQLRELTVKEER